MITIESLMTIDKDQLSEAAKDMDGSGLPLLIELLSEKNDNIRYRAFLALQYRSRFFSDVYPFWEIFRSKLKSDNSYQRSIGLMLIAENARVRDPRRTLDCRRYPHHASDQEDDPEHTRLRDRVGARMEEVCHRPLQFRRASRRVLACDVYAGISDNTLSVEHRRLVGQRRNLLDFGRRCSALSDVSQRVFPRRTPIA
jgi:hypothetical protein